MSDNLFFLKGQSDNLPNKEDRVKGGFYLASDASDGKASKIYIDDMVIEDSETLKNAILGNYDGLTEATQLTTLADICKAIVSNEETVAHALTHLKENKVELEELNNYALTTDVPTALSQLTNDAGFITADNIDLTGYAKESWVNEQGFIKEIPSEYVTESELDSKGYLTEVPSEYVTETELEAKGYLTAESMPEIDLTAYATKAEVDDFKEESIKNERVIAAALTNLNDTKANASDVKTYTIGSVSVEDANVKEAWGLFEGDTQVGETIKVYTESALQNVEFVSTDGNGNEGQFLKFTYLIDGSESVIYLNVSELLAQSEFKNGLAVADNGTVSVKVDEESETFLTVSENGIKISGVQNAIDALLGDYSLIEEDDQVKTIADLNKAMIDNELVLAQALNDLEERKVNFNDMPTKVSDFENDLGYITISDIPNVDFTGYATEEWVENQGYITADNMPDIDLTDYATIEYVDEIEFVTSSALNSLNKKVDGVKDEILGDYSVLENDSEYAPYIVKTLAELNQAVIDGELVTASALTDLKENKANVEHTHNLSELNNDAGFITADDVPQQSVDLTGYAKESYVDEKVAALVNGAPATLDTLDELAAALKDNKDIVTVLENSIATKQNAIEDLDTIRDGAALGATAIQSVKTINGQSIVGSGDIEIKGGTDVNLNDYYTKSEIDDKGYLYKVILTQAQYNELVEYDPQALYVISDATEDSQNNFVTESQLNDRGFLTSSDRVEIEEMFSAYENALSSLEATITSLQAKIAELEAKLDDTLTI